MYKRQGLPTVVLEAMAVGTPVVASRVGGIPEIITHSKNGLLVEPGDTEGLQQSIALMLHSEAERMKILHTATERVRQEYDWSKVVLQYLATYEKLRNQN